MAWLGLMIGNSRLHFVGVAGGKGVEYWRGEHGQGPEDLPERWRSLPLFFASVVPQQTPFWADYGREITLGAIPLQGMYPTLGSDRALAAYGAAQDYGTPVLIVDGGTALTLTAIAPGPTLAGGAILPGLGLQLRSLAQQTGALPAVALPDALPPRWSCSTPEAIQSGILYTVLAGVEDFIHHWRARHPQAPVILTGGDGPWLHRHLGSDGDRHHSPHLVLAGLIAVIHRTGMV
ncbi:MAG: pantothenate kinase [Spirulina sp. DLM2.Bin59]|nr:MAG: pantothenate kinase [Spirulina sp. DLM2.Bin59]